MKNIVLIMTLIVSCLFAGCDSLANKSEDKLSGDDFWAQGNETNAEAFFVEHIQFVSECNNVTTSFPYV
ncbi:hypothetical protein [Bacteroides thetaiotaomicron]|uniref:hypothetical protein n=1 Tax=Bacteroides thetaiotaomicron TaxID=818 RepID=UPI002165C8FB|nr:hypothetical protein [Bacteroides thetaiotaomicron]MCS3043473.1 hypothetical protein [Bacteroides thetaiotaomicron]